MRGRFAGCGVALCVLLGAASRARAEPAVPALSSPGAAEVAPLPSPGCRLAPAQRTQKGPAGHLLRSLSSGGSTRRFLLVLPAEPGPGPAPLVLNFHGLMESPQLHQLLTRMDEETRARGWVLAYPQGIGLSWNAGACCGRAKREASDDVQFARDLVAQLGRELCLDRRRVYATGISNGGFFSYRLACEAGDLIAAAAPVAALDGMVACDPKQPVPVLAINGSSDLLVPYDGGGLLDLPSAAESFSRWRKRNRCGAGERVALQQGDARCVAAEGCAADTALCTIDGGGHTWPAGHPALWLGKTSEDLHATRTILDFFAGHARR